MAEYVITGKFRMKNREQNFTKSVNANSEKHAVHTVKALIGSKHKTLGHTIKIEKVELKK